MKYRKIPLIIVFVFMLSAIISEKAYADVPYNGYTYDAYGRSVPTAVCYQPDKHVTGEDMNAGLLKNPQDMFITSDNEVYVLDSGNKRIVVLDKNLKTKRIIDRIVDKKGKISKLKNPSGIFVTDKKLIYITDTDNHRVISINLSGVIQKTFVKPTSQLYPSDSEFNPTKVIVDRAEDVYVIVDGVYQGAVMYDKNCNFTGFYGTNKVEVNLKAFGDYFWKTFFMNKNQRRNTIRYIPTAYTNFYIDKDGFIYVCSKDDDSDQNQLRKLNSLGNNILRTNDNFWGYGDVETVLYSGRQIKTSFVDVNADSDDFINVVDYTRGRIFQYDQDSNLIAVFGGKGNQEGTFDSPAAVDTLNGKILVLDSKRGDITVFSLTEFGQWVHKAVKLYDDGLYEDSVKPWKEVLKRDNKLEIAHMGLGKALLKEGKYREAMKNFKLAYDVSDYSSAYGQYMAAFVRKNIGIIAATIVLLYVLVKLFKRRKIAKSINNGVSSLKRKVKESLYGAG